MLGLWGSKLGPTSAHTAPPPPGPLPAPLLVLCPSEDELRCWLYHLEKQMALVGGLRRCHSVPPQVIVRNLPAPLPSFPASLP